MPAFALLPLWVEERGGTIGQLGWIQSAFGIGTLAGGLALGAWGGFSQKIRTTAFGIVLLGAAVLSMSALGPLGGIVAMAIAGVAVWYVAGGALCLAVGAVMLARPDLLDIERAGTEVLGSPPESPSPSLAT